MERWLERPEALALFVLAALLLLTGAALGKGLRLGPRALAPGVLTAVMAVAIAAARPPFGPAAWGLLAGSLLAVVGLSLGHPCALAGVAAAAGGVIALHGAPSIMPALGVAAGACVVAWPIAAANPAAPAALPLAALLSFSAIGAAFGLQSERLPLLAWAAPALAALVGVAAAVAPLAERLGRAGSAFLAALLLAAAAGVMAAIGRPVLALPFALGLVAAALLAGLEPGSAAPVRLRDGLLAALLLVLTGAVSFGLGRGLGLAAAGLALLALTPAWPRPAVRAAVAGILIWCLIRLAYARLGSPAGRLDLAANTPLIGLLLGALGAPAAVASLALTGRRAAVPSLFVLAAPAAVAVVLWGQSAAAGAIGGALAVVVVLTALGPLLGGVTAELSEAWDRLPEAAATLAAVSLPIAATLGSPEIVPRTVKSALLVLLVLLLAVLGRSPAAGDAR